jgi:predicted metal-binding membrane protein
MLKHARVRSRISLTLVTGAAVAWAVSVERMRGMDAGPGTDLGSLEWFLVIWVTMTAAMMLPTTVPAAEHVARLARRAPTVLFTAGYLAVWTVYGILAYGVYQLVVWFDIGRIAWDRDGPYVAGAVIVAAGLYELTTLKRGCLDRCRTGPPTANALRGGLAHGLDCVGCSGALMAVLFVLGAMSLVWMAVLAVAIFAEKVLPRGQRFASLVAVVLVALGLSVALSPGTVPGPTEPGGGMSMQMDQ